MASKSEEELKHPSYGMVQFSRRSGNPKLFGSAIENHQHYICLSIRRATLIREDTGDRYYGAMMGDMIEVNLSAAQFAELLTTMNVGMGVPCTISRLENRGIEPPPDIPSTTEKIKTNFKERFMDFANATLKGANAIRETLSKKALNNADRKQILDFMDRIAQELKDNAPFLLEMYEEATEKIVGAAKAEIDSFMTTLIHQAGIAALQERVQHPALPGGSKDPV